MQFIHDIHTAMQFIHGIHTAMQSPHDIHTAMQSIHDIQTAMQFIYDIHTAMQYLHDIHTAMQSLHNIHTAMQYICDIHTAMQSIYMIYTLLCNLYLVYTLLCNPYIYTHCHANSNFLNPFAFCSASNCLSVEAFSIPNTALHTTNFPSRTDTYYHAETNVQALALMARWQGTPMHTDIKKTYTHVFFSPVNNPNAQKLLSTERV